jgi:hypothetical protein
MTIFLYLHTQNALSLISGHYALSSQVPEQYVVDVSLPTQTYDITNTHAPSRADKAPRVLSAQIKIYGR